MGKSKNKNKDKGATEAVLGAPEEALLSASQTLPNSPSPPSVARMAVGSLVGSMIPGLIGTGVAYAITTFSAQDASKIATLASLDLAPVCYAAAFFTAVVRFLNFFPVGFKSAAMDGKAKGNIRANMYLYTVDDNKGRNSFIVLEDKGAAGIYNRANRSLHHFVENAWNVVICFPIAGFVSPRPTAALTALYGLGRIIHQTGYTAGYGKHAPGFLLAMITGLALEGLVILAGVKASGLL